jgi:hypothetical protein
MQSSHLILYNYMLVLYWISYGIKGKSDVSDECVDGIVASRVSSRRLTLLFRASVILHPTSVLYIEFVMAVPSKVAGAPTASACKVSVASLFHWGGGGGRALSESSGFSWSSLSGLWKAFQLEELIEGLSECLVAPPPFPRVAVVSFLAPLTRRRIQQRLLP